MPEEFVCLGQFRVHSWYPWGSKPGASSGGYWRQCSLSGCPQDESAEELRPVGDTVVVDRATGRAQFSADGHEHAWGGWFSDEDGSGCLASYPYRYRRRCKTCQADELALDLVPAYVVV